MTTKKARYSQVKVEQEVLDDFKIVCTIKKVKMQDVLTQIIKDWLNREKYTWKKHIER